MAQNKSVARFVLDSAMAVAEGMLPDRRIFRLNAEQWKAFNEALDAPPQLHERLERLLQEPSVID